MSKRVREDSPETIKLKKNLRRCLWSKGNFMAARTSFLPDSAFKELGKQIGLLREHISVTKEQIHAFAQGRLFFHNCLRRLEEMDHDRQKKRWVPGKNKTDFQAEVRFAVEEIVGTLFGQPALVQARKICRFEFREEFFATAHAAAWAWIERGALLLQLDSPWLTSKEVSLIKAEMDQELDLAVSQSLSFVSENCRSPVEQEQFSQTLFGIAGNGKVERTIETEDEEDFQVDPLGRLSKKQPHRRCFKRDHIFLQCEKGGMTPAQIRDRWNRESHPLNQISGGPQGIDTVKKSLKRAKKE